MTRRCVALSVDIRIMIMMTTEGFIAPEARVSTPVFIQCAPVRYQNFDATIGSSMVTSIQFGSHHSFGVTNTPLINMEKWR